MEISEVQNTIGTKFPGMTYEDGLRAMLDWLRGVEKDSPLAD